MLELDLDKIRGEIRQGGRVIAKITFEDSRAENDIEDVINEWNKYKDIDLEVVSELKDMVLEKDIEQRMNDVEETISTSSKLFEDLTEVIDCISNEMER